jgi:hypothetical protein
MDIKKEKAKEREWKRREKEKGGGGTARGRRKWFIHIRRKHMTRIESE